MKLHLFGLPLNLHRRLKEESSNWREALPDGCHRLGRPQLIQTHEWDRFSEPELRELKVAAVGDGFTPYCHPSESGLDWKSKGLPPIPDCRTSISPGSANHLKT